MSVEQACEYAVTHLMVGVSAKIRGQNSEVAGRLKLRAIKRLMNIVNILFCTFREGLNCHAKLVTANPGF